MHDQRGDVDPPEILSEVGLAEGLDAIVSGLDPAHHALPPPVVDEALGHLRARPIEAKECSRRDVPKSCARSTSRAVRYASKTSKGSPPGLAAVFGMSGGTAPMRTALATRPLARPAPWRPMYRDLAAARRVPDVDRVLEVELLGQRDEIVGIRVHLVAVPRLGRTPVSATVVRDAPEAARREEDHLRVPVVGAQRPAMAEHDGLGVPQSLQKICVPSFDVIIDVWALLMRAAESVSTTPADDRPHSVPP
jgi:hypothetical protein